MKNHFFDFKLFAAPDASDQQEQCSGAGKKKVLIVYQSEEKNTMLQDFLSRILGAVQLDLQEDVRLCVITPGTPLSLSALRRDFPFNKAILFGASPTQLGLQFEPAPYKLTEHAGIHYLFTDELQEIFEERQQGGKKRAGALWRELREMFPERVD